MSPAPRARSPAFLPPPCGGRFGGEEDPGTGAADTQREYLNLKEGVTRPRPGPWRCGTWGHRDSQVVGFPDPGKFLKEASRPLESGSPLCRRTRPWSLRSPRLETPPGAAFGFSFLFLLSLVPDFSRFPSHTRWRGAQELHLAPLPTAPRPPRA